MENQDTGVEREALQHWLEKSDLEKAVSLGTSGGLELGKEETAYYLGEFPDRVILDLTLKEASNSEGLSKVKAALSNPEAKAVILHGDASAELEIQYIKLAQEYGCSCTVRHNPEFKGKVGLIVVSD